MIFEHELLSYFNNFNQLSIDSKDLKFNFYKYRNNISFDIDNDIVIDYDNPLKKSKRKYNINDWDNCLNYLIDLTVNHIRNYCEYLFRLINDKINNKIKEVYIYDDPWSKGIKIINPAFTFYEKSRHDSYYCCEFFTPYFNNSEYFKIISNRFKPRLLPCAINLPIKNIKINNFIIKTIDNKYWRLKNLKDNLTDIIEVNNLSELFDNNKLIDIPIINRNNSLENLLIEYNYYTGDKYSLELIYKNKEWIVC